MSLAGWTRGCHRQQGQQAADRTPTDLVTKRRYNDRSSGSHQRSRLLEISSSFRKVT